MLFCVAFCSLPLYLLNDLLIDDSGVTSYSGGGRIAVKGSVLKKRIHAFVSPTKNFSRLDTGKTLSSEVYHINL